MDHVVLEVVLQVVSVVGWDFHSEAVEKFAALDVDVLLLDVDVDVNVNADDRFVLIASEKCCWKSLCEAPPVVLRL